MRAPIAIVVLVTFLSSLWSEPTFAQARAQHPMKGIAIIGFQPTTVASETDLLDGMTTYLRGRSDLQLIPIESVNNYLTSLQLKQDTKSLLLLKQGVELYDKGKRDYERKKFKDALSFFDLAASTLERGLPYMENNRNLLMTYLYRGMTKTALKQREEGRADIRRMLELNSQRTSQNLNGKIFPLDIIATYNKLRKEVQAKATAKLLVDAPQGGARVTLDGNRLGMVPYTATALTPGKHSVTLYKRGFERWTQEVEVRAGDENRLDASLVRWVPFHALAPENVATEMDTLSALKAIATNLKCDLLILGQLALPTTAGSSLIKGQLYSVTGDMFSRIETLELEDATYAKERGQQFTKALLTQLTVQGDVLPATSTISGFKPMLPEGNEGAKTPASSARKVDLQPPVATPATSIPYMARTPTVAKERRPPFYKQPLFWGILGGAAVAGGLGLWLFTDIFKPEADNNVLVIDNPGN